MDAVPGAAEAFEQDEDSQGEEKRDEGEDQEHEGHHVNGIVKFNILQIHAGGVICPAPKIDIGIIDSTVYFSRQRLGSDYFKICEGSAKFFQS